MMRLKFVWIILLAMSSRTTAQDYAGNFLIKNCFDTLQYVSADAEFLDYAEKPDGYWLFLPQSPRPDTAEVLVFLHGYGGYNPLIYGKWIRHLVRQGNIVLYPRYQKNLLRPRPHKFAANTAQAVRDARRELEKRTDIIARWDNLTMVGHSYGGVVAADLAANADKYEVPQPQAIMLVSPGTAWLKRGRLESYEDIPQETKVLITVSQDDHTTKDEFGILVFETAVHTPQRVLYRQFAARDSLTPITAGHNESYCVDLDFDGGARNYTAKRALRISQLNALDYNGYWRLFDLLIACQRSSAFCDLAFGKEGFNLGKNAAGEDFAPFRVTLPED